VNTRGIAVRRRGWHLLGGAAALLVAVVGVAPPAVAGPSSHGSKQRGDSARWRFDATATTLSDVARVVGADRLHRGGVTGDGVGVAIVDTGVAPVPGLLAGNVTNGPDLSLESQAPELRHLDGYGHGTHLAGIIAGDDEAAGFHGLAPGARLTSVKVGSTSGAADVTQVLAAIDWVVEHRADDPKHPIRVLNLAYGTDGTQDYRVDPLAYAVENAWRAGIVVVTAAGNGGTAAPALANPAIDPYVIAVGSADNQGTVRTTDDVVSDFSGRGGVARRVDLVAPGRSLVSLRQPGSAADVASPAARVGGLYLKGSGTSQAAAVVSGAVALLLEERPELTPDQVKALLVRTAARLPKADAAGHGAGELDVARAVRTRAVPAVQRWQRSTGTGSVEAARGSAHLTIADQTLTGEYDLFGRFDTASWAAASAAGTAWDRGRWMGNQWTGDGWTDGGGSWLGHTWSGHTWSGHTWSGHTWSGHTWSGHTWSGHTWSGHTWSGNVWGD
jgi:serine protease AprX